MDNEARLANLQKMAAADPDNELAHFSLGKLYLESKSLEAAAASLRRALELNPKHSLAHQLLGETLLARGEKAAAVEVLTAGMVLAHEKGEYMPRDRMRDILVEQGVEPPQLAAAGPAESEAGGASEGDFVCRRCNRVSAPLAEAPFKSELGERILATTCVPCWREWMGMSIKVINEMRLNLMSPKDSEVYDQHMKEFLGL